jgi:hypothetical protein
VYFSNSSHFGVQFRAFLCVPLCPLWLRVLGFLAKLAARS